MNRTRLTEAEQQELLLRLQRTYRYDAEHGRLVNRKTDRALKGKIQNCGYSEINLWLGSNHIYIKMHRAVFAICHGRWPTETIDHINGCKTDNHIENLREASQSDNQLNQLLPWKPNKDTGLPGISPHKWVYRTNLHGKVVWMADPFRLFYHTTLLGKIYQR